MKALLSIALVSLFSATAFADIQDPPVNDYGPTRKLSRGVANLMWGWTELVYQPNVIQEREGNVAAWTYGPIRGVGRTFFRMGAGVWEIVSFPFATNKGTYKPSYRSNIPWIHGGYEEFAPELGFESRYRYTRHYHGW
jgi:putative exosortase-associated protein (TIGR04073 family)